MSESSHGKKIYRKKDGAEISYLKGYLKEVKYLRNTKLLFLQAFISILSIISTASFSYSACPTSEIYFICSIPSAIYKVGFYMEKDSTLTTMWLRDIPVITYTAPEDGYYFLIISRQDMHQIFYDCDNPDACRENWIHNKEYCDPPSEVPASPAEPSYVWKYMGEISGSATASFPDWCQNIPAFSVSQWVYKKSKKDCEISVRVSPSEVWPKETGGNTQASVVVSSTKPAPPEGCTVILKVEPVENSGGHSHGGNRPKGTVNPTTITIPGGSLAAVSATYNSSEVSGEEKIKAEVKGETKSEATIKVLVPGFLELGEGDGYALIGQTSSHPQNHYGTENTLYSLLDIAGVYYETEKGTLRINDISLEWGGLFDIKANWSTPHKSHRTGKNVDVDDVTAEGKAVTARSLEKVIKKLKSNITILSEGNHFHLTFP